MVRQVGRAETRIRRIVAKLSVRDQMPDDVDAESVDATSKPEAHHLIDGRSDSSIAPIEARRSGRDPSRCTSRAWSLVARLGSLGTTGADRRYGWEPDQE